MYFVYFRELESIRENEINVHTLESEMEEQIRAFRILLISSKTNSNKNVIVDIQSFIDGNIDGNECRIYNIIHMI